MIHMNCFFSYTWSKEGPKQFLPAWRSLGRFYSVGNKKLAEWHQRRRYFFLKTFIIYCDTRKAFGNNPQLGRQNVDFTTPWKPAVMWQHITSQLPVNVSEKRTNIDHFSETWLWRGVLGLVPVFIGNHLPAQRGMRFFFVVVLFFLTGDFFFFISSTFSYW